MDFAEQLNLPWTDFSFVAFDLETSGAYPVGSEIIEFGAVKWKAGREVASFQTLLRPKEKLSAFNISIHGITNEMLEGAPQMSEKIAEIHQFIQGSLLLAHHAPFDMGFLAYDFERFQLPFPEEPVICTSLLARKLIPESPNHKLQTLIKVLNLVGGQAHRGLDDARACLQLGLLCMERLGPGALLKDVFTKVEKDLSWPDFSIIKSENAKIEVVRMATETKKDLDIFYEGGSLKGLRRISPQGIVRNPDGDYIQAICHIDRISKRFYLDKIKDMHPVL